MTDYYKYIKYKQKYLSLKYNKMTYQNNNLDKHLIQFGGKNNDGSLEMYNWIKDLKPKHLTIKDLLKWDKNEIKDVAIFDRNFEEYFIWNKLEKDKKYKPEYFFSANKHQIKYNGDLTWDIIYNFGETICHDVELDVTNFNNGWTWYPLDKGYLNVETGYANGKINKLQKNKQKKIFWKDMDTNTRIGWRGPIMLWSDVITGPEVYQK